MMKVESKGSNMHRMILYRWSQSTVARQQRFTNVSNANDYDTPTMFSLNTGTDFMSAVCEVSMSAKSALILPILEVASPCNWHRRHSMFTHVKPPSPP
jgi:hypothetical protein